MLVDSLMLCVPACVSLLLVRSCRCVCSHISARVGRFCRRATLLAPRPLTSGSIMALYSGATLTQAWSCEAVKLY